MSKVLILRTCHADMTSYSGFVWPESGPVEAPDWAPTHECGNGLHGFLWGEGEGSLANWSDDARWLIVEVEEDVIVQLNGKVKFPRGNVVFVGDRKAATDYIGGRGKAVIGSFVTAEDRGTATAGYGGTATSGDRGTATAGYQGTAIAGDRGTATAGDEGTATAGYGGTATAGYGGTATAWNEGTATAGYRGMATAGNVGTAIAGHGGTAIAGHGGTATAGNVGTAIAGYGGTAIAGHGGTAIAGNGGTSTAGDRGTATVGDGGTATAGDRGTIIITWYDSNLHRLAVGYVGEGIEPDTPYRVVGGKLVPVK